MSSEKLKGIKRYEYLSSDDGPPIVLKLRIYLGSTRALIVIGLGLAVLSGSLTVAWYIFGAADQVSGSRLVHLCRVLFPLIVGVESTTLVFVTPAIAAVAFGDKWKEEANGLVQELPKSAYRLVAKGIVSAVARTLLIPLAAVPLEIVAFLPYGPYRISVTEIETLLSEQMIFLATASTLSAVGLLFSSACSWSRWAVKTYVTVFLVTTGPLLVAFPLEALLYPALTPPSRYQMAYLIWLASPILLNPVVSALFTTESSLNTWRTVADAGGQAVMAPIWFVYTVVCVALTVILLLVTARRLHRHASEQSPRS